MAAMQWLIWKKRDKTFAFAPHSHEAFCRAIDEMNEADIGWQSLANPDHIELRLMIPKSERSHEQYLSRLGFTDGARVDGGVNRHLRDTINAIAQDVMRNDPRTDRR